MVREPQHPRAEPHLWPVVAMGAILAAQVALLQVAVNRLEWGLYATVFSPAVGVLALSLAAWLLYRQLDREKL
jgi:multidrug transporter EmrE-like cation transporter